MKITKRQLRKIVSEEINKARSGRLSEAEGPPSRDAAGNLTFRVGTLQEVGELNFDRYIAPSGMNTLNGAIDELATQVLEQLQDLHHQGYDVVDTEMYASAVSEKVFEMVLDKIDTHLFA